MACPETICLPVFRRVTALLLPVLLVAGSVAAHDTSTHGRYLIRTWTSEEGLPQNSAHNILQATDGHIFIGTQEGLVRFDGSSFTVFDADSNPAFSDNHVLSLLQARDRTLWIGTESGVVRLRERSFERVAPGSALDHARAKVLVEDHDSTLWVGCRGGGLFRLSPRGTIESVELPPELRHSGFLSGCVDQDGSLWFGTDGSGLLHLTGTAVHRFTAADGLPDDRVSVLLSDDQGRLWAGTAGGGLVRRDEGRFESIGLKGIDTRINALFEDSTGSLWIGTHGQGLLWLHEGNLQTFDTSSGLSNDVILSLCKDHEGSLWAGTDGGGINQLKSSMFQVLDSSRGLSHDVVFPIIEDHAGNMWVGTEGGGLDRISPDGRVEVLTTADGLSDDKVFSLYEDNAGTLWIGTYGGGVSRLRNGVIDTLTTADGLASELIWAIAGDSSGRIWIGTDGGGLDCWEHGLITNYSTRNGLSNDRITCIHEARDGAIWVGTAGGGLDRFDGTEWTVYDSTRGLSNDDVLAIFEDGSGALWIGTSGGGLNRLANGVFVACTKEHGLHDNLVYQVLDDGMGNLWMSCNKGIFRVRKEELDAFADGTVDRVVSYSYGRAAGMKSVECNGISQPPGTRRSDGTLWFPTLKGVVIIEPGRLRRNIIPPPVVIEHLYADGSEVPLTDGVRLRAGTRNIEIRYTGLSFIAPDKLHFRSFLEGYEEDWSDVGNRRAAYYTNLEPGEYRFRVTACNSDGVCSVPGASVSFYLAPYLRQRVWFRGAVMVAVLLAALAFHRARIRELQRREEELAARVDAAVAEIKILAGLLPICASCKKIRDKNDWWPVEEYIRDHSQAEFSHGLCPDCARELYGGMTTDEDT